MNILRFYYFCISNSHCTRILNSEVERENTRLTQTAQESYVINRIGVKE